VNFLALKKYTNPGGHPIYYFEGEENTVVFAIPQLGDRSQ